VSGTRTLILFTGRESDFRVAQGRNFGFAILDLGIDVGSMTAFVWLFRMVGDARSHEKAPLERSL
jgi:hypothetical protein